MGKGIKNFIKRIFHSRYGCIPQEFKESFDEELLELNLSREMITGKILIIAGLLLIVIDIMLNWKIIREESVYRYLMLYNLLLVAVLSMYFLAVNRISDYRRKKWGNWLHMGFLTFTLSWCVLVSVNSQLTHNQIFIYIIGFFYVAAALVLKPKESLFLYVFTFIQFYTGLNIVEKNPQALRGHIMNPLILLIFSYIVSRITFDSYIKNFIYKKIAERKTLELENAQKSLEDTVKKRTEQLANEMNMRHEAELQAVRAQLLYDEKESILKETIEYEKLRTDFFANISHEFRTPLNVIFSANQILESIAESSVPSRQKPVKKYLSTIRQNCYRLIRLIGNLIDITKIDAGYFKVSLENHDIVSIVENITLSVAEYMEDKEIDLTFDTEAEEKIMACDPDKIERIMLNLLSNAVKFTPKGGSIYVDIFDNEDKIVISVKDTGVGIPREKQNMIFERFVQADKSLSRGNEGSGIGLSLVKSLVEMHDGRVYFESEEGRGSDFFVELPVHLLPSTDKIDEGEEFKKDTKIEVINVEFSDIYF